MKIQKIPTSGYEEVLSCRDPVSGLRAFIAIHSTRLGPALGGIRMFPYPHEEEALSDVLRLARAMTYKAAAAHLKLGGGKAVMIGDPEKSKTPRMLKAMAEFIHSLEGRYISAKDSGISIADLIHIADYTSHVAGLPEFMGGSDDPSPWTAMTVLEAVRFCVQKRLKKDSLTGIKVLVQGAGHVGAHLCRLLDEEDARLYVSDPNDKCLKKALRLGARSVPVEKIYTEEAAVFAPCAMGKVINDKTLPVLKCAIIAGGANNQLENEFLHGRALQKRGILYAPDFIVNAGGVINIYVKDILKEKNPMPWFRRIGSTLEEVFSLAERKGISTAEAANLYAESVLESGLLPHDI